MHAPEYRRAFDRGKAQFEVQVDKPLAIGKVEIEPAVRARSDLNRIPRDPEHVLVHTAHQSAICFNQPPVFFRPLCHAVFGRHAAKAKKQRQVKAFIGQLCRRNGQFILYLHAFSVHIDSYSAFICTGRTVAFGFH